MSVPRRRPWTCGFWPTPPKTVIVVRPADFARGLQGLLDLVHELTRRREDQRARRLGARGAVRLGEAGDQREQERVRLAGAGAAAAEHVATRERVGQRGGLDGGRVGDAEVREDGDKASGDAEIGEARSGHCRRQGEDHSLLACLASRVSRGGMAQSREGTTRGPPKPEARRNGLLQTSLGQQPVQTPNRRSVPLRRQRVRPSLTSLAASLTCSPAFLTLPLAWSALPSASRSPVAGRLAGRLLALALELLDLVLGLVLQSHGCLLGCRTEAVTDRAAQRKRQDAVVDRVAADRAEVGEVVLLEQPRRPVALHRHLVERAQHVAGARSP